MMRANEIQDGGATSPLGFIAGAAACGLKASGSDDLAILASDRDCTGAGVFTRNRVAAAPVVVCRETLQAESSRLRAVVVNAGNANACTGEGGLRAARQTQALAAARLACRPGQVLVLSTGVIGMPLDMQKMARGIGTAASGLTREGGARAARAIMTTDTRPKHLAVSLDLSGGRVTLGAMAKGSGMIHPDMATMLAVITTDAAAPAEALRGLLRGAVESSFNRISVDGDTSTNDSVLLLANGAAGVRVEAPDREAFAEALDGLCGTLARAIVRDGEGARKFVTLHVTGAASEAAALQVARAVATSPLVKTALAGGDPNWGRILAAAGRAGVELDPGRLCLRAGAGPGGGVALVEAGARAGYDEAEAARCFDQPEVELSLDLGQGEARVTFWTCDLTQEYVAFNADYHT